MRVGAHGRLVIPAPLRRALHLMPGERLVARQAGNSLVRERRATVERRLQERFRRVPAGVSLIEELIRGRCRGLEENARRLFVTCALANLDLARRRLLRPQRA